MKRVQELVGVWALFESPPEELRSRWFVLEIVRTGMFSRGNRHALPAKPDVKI